ncbi:MAG: hypothetical protein KGZ63_00770 [Clostridiales bacterium]|nr:hypothetical protein [Clostridiales bacterium]
MKVVATVTYSDGTTKDVDTLSPEERERLALGFAKQAARALAQHRGFDIKIKDVMTETSTKESDKL